MKRPAIMAHRGASSQAPENTIPAFLMAMDQKADGIELDVHLTKDGIPVVIHDETTDRTGTGRGRIMDRTLAELEQDDFGVKCNARFAGTRISSLKSILMLLGSWHGYLNIELKTDVFTYPGIEEVVLKLVGAAGMGSRVIISSFRHASLDLCRKINPDIEMAALFSHGQVPDLSALKARGITAIHPDVRSVTPGAVRRWHRAGFKVRPYTVDSKPLLLWQAMCGVDAVFTNKPLESAAFLAAVCKKACTAEDQVQ